MDKLTVSQLKINNTYKEVICEYQTRFRRNFLVNSLKQGDTLWLMLKIITDNDNLKEIKNERLLIPKDEIRKERCFLTIYDKIKQDFDDFINEFSRIKVEIDNNEYILSYNNDKESEHELTYEEYVGFIIQLFETRMKKCNNKEAIEIIKKNLAKIM